MTVQVEFWHLITLLGGYIGSLCGFGMILFNKIDKHIDSQNVRITRLEKELADHKADLPLNYWRREDAIRVEVGMKTRLVAIGEHIVKMMEEL